MKLPFFPIHFNSAGRLTGAGAGAINAWITSRGITDLFVFSHGWNNDEPAAAGLYESFFTQMSDVLASCPLRGRAVIGAAGLSWPSILWPDNRGELARMQQLLDTRPASDAALREFKQSLSSLVSQDEAAGEPEGALGVHDDDDCRDLFDALAPAPVSAGGAAGFNPFARLWAGAKSALRLGSYYHMKSRAGVIGEQGLGPLLSPLETRVHLLGHSFGARLVSYALKPAPAGRVKSVFMLQGAFSHFAFAAKLPFDATRSGELAGLDAKVDGPLLVTHSLHDKAVGSAYPLASFAARQDASALANLDYRWAAMGHDGAQCVDAAAAGLHAPRLPRSKWINADGNRVIGGHSDIVHPQTAWYALAAAGLVAPDSGARFVVDAAAPRALDLQAAWPCERNGCLR